MRLRDADDSGGASRLTLVLGGARSGKSALAERLVAARSDAPAYIATAEARDADMRARIEEHRRRRGPAWRTVEAPLDLAGALTEAKEAALVDCLTLWLSNLMEAGRDPAAEGERLVAALSARAAPAVLVSNEVGLGLVPETPLGRAFRDAAGRLNQQVAECCDTVLFVAAGLPMTLKAPEATA